MATCNICCETYNNKTRKQTECPYCEFDSCMACQKTFILDTFNDSHCMSCKRAYRHEQLTNIFPKTFLVKPYKEHRENILYEREKCMLPASQAELELDARKQVVREQTLENNKRIRAINNEMWQFHIKTGRLYSRTNLTDEERVWLDKQGKELKVCREKSKLLTLQRRELMYAHLGSEEQNKREFVKKCPGEGCNGFLSTAWKCGMCNIRVCSKCLEEKDENNHECDPENVKTAELIAKETKPCPACGTRIFKISGCSQMWCTSCHVAFNWNTLRIETGVVHNPHFYEFQRASNGGVAPRVPGDNGGCDHEMPYVWTCIRTWEVKARGLSKVHISRLTDIHRLTTHISHYEVHNLPNGYEVNANSDIRKLFLKNLIDEKKFKWILQRREKKMNKGREIRQLYEMFTTCCKDLIGRSILENATPSEVNKIFKEYATLSNYFNESAAKIQNVYGGVAPNIVCQASENPSHAWYELQHVAAPKKSRSKE